MVNKEFMKDLRSLPPLVKVFYAGHRLAYMIQTLYGTPKPDDGGGDDDHKDDDAGNHDDGPSTSARYLSLSASYFISVVVLSFSIMLNYV